MILSYLLTFYPYLHSPFSNDFPILEKWIPFCLAIVQKFDLLAGLDKRNLFDKILNRLSFPDGLEFIPNFNKIRNFFVYTAPLWFLLPNPDNFDLAPVESQNFVESFYDQFLFIILNNFFSLSNISFGGLRIFFQHHSSFISLIYNESSNSIQKSQALYNNFQKFSVFYAALIECQLECQFETFSFSIDDDKLINLSHISWTNHLFLDSKSFLDCFFDPNERYSDVRQSYFNKKFISIWVSDPLNFEI
uniref:Uncharacterized protein n=1 Tax=Coptotermes formosanus TaxID=36987 RepID=R4UP12_COPFO|nr:hypothetical protein [Coptotermes formosanus]